MCAVVVHSSVATILVLLVHRQPVIDGLESQIIEQPERTRSVVLHPILLPSRFADVSASILIDAERHRISHQRLCRDQSLLVSSRDLDEIERRSSFIRPLDPL